MELLGANGPQFRVIEPFVPRHARVVDQDMHDERACFGVREVVLCHCEDVVDAADGVGEVCLHGEGADGVLRCEGAAEGGGEWDGAVGGVV